MNVMDIAFIVSCCGWLAFELWINIRDRAKFDVTNNKRSGTLLLILIAIALAICGIMQATDLLRIPLNVDVRILTGTIIVVSGAFIRWWAVWYLGKYFLTVAAVQDGQKVIKRGPYKYIRHPSYTGAMLVLFGFGLGLGSWIGMAALLILPFWGYYRRIKLEEQVMITRFQKEYLNYVRETRKIIPFIY